MEKTAEKTIKAELYKWGEYEEPEGITREEFNEMVELEREYLLGFFIDKNHYEKKFFAHPDYIDTGADGTSIKYAYAINKEDIE